jgi:16S rRNA processing protein RimM
MASQPPQSRRKPAKPQAPAALPLSGREAAFAQAWGQLDEVVMPADAVEVAYIGDAWGIKGAFKVHPHSSLPEAIFSSKRWYISPKRSLPTQVLKSYLLPVSQAKEHGDAVVVTSPEFADRTAAEALKGASVWVPRSSFPTPEEGEYYWVDLIGCTVLNREGVTLGVVSELLASGPQSTLVIDPPEGDAYSGQRMVPFVGAFVDTVDVAAKRITVDWQPDY